ncbi:unnamed protein product [Timema podura]|uniref:CHY-type domain-containing protein n=1 Tax=Timema podura TaxID=61482 RepID=A0ABN7PDM7_TIMPD|nr:unnamed protein product [Timema podura]
MQVAEFDSNLFSPPANSSRCLASLYLPGLLFTPCCNKIYFCRFCHDENESHPVNRKDVTELVCTNCDTRQKVQAECEHCNLRFGKVGIVSSTVLPTVTKQNVLRRQKLVFG